MIFIAYYTTASPYSNVAAKYLVPSLLKLDLSAFVKAVPNRGNWVRNTLYKPRFILNAMQHFKDEEAVVYLDVDAEVVRYPSLFWEIPPEYDIAVHYLDWDLQWKGKPGKKRELLSGTMMFRYNDKVLQLLKDYIIACESGKFSFEQVALQELLDTKYKDIIKVFKLPPEYCTVLLHDDSVPPYIDKPVIIHHQVSRKYRDQ